MSEIITVYRTVCYSAPDPDLEGENCSLLPWAGGSGLQGTDDGGRDYVLPENYRSGETEDGAPAVFGASDEACRLTLHNGCPLLVDAVRHMAFLLEPVRKIASFREAAGLTREDLAARLGVTQKTLFEWENLEKEPDPATLARIAEILGCDPGDFR